MLNISRLLFNNMLFKILFGILMLNNAQAPALFK